MRNEVDMIRAINQTVLKTIDASKPMGMVYGEVSKINPLEIKIDQKLTLPEDNLILTRAVTDYETELSLVGSAKQKYMVYNALKVGDKVLMLRVQNGNQYLIIDKEVS